MRRFLAAAVWRGCLAEFAAAVMATGAAARSAGRNVNYDESKVGPYVLPDALPCGDGSKVATPEPWTQRRRPEIPALFEQHVFDRTPTNYGRVAFEVRQCPTVAMEGRATRKIVAITLPDRPAWPGIEAMIYIPNGLGRPAPCVVGASFGGNHAVTTESDVPPSTRWMPPVKNKGIVNNRATEDNRGASSSRWPIQRILDAGCALATYYYGDVEPDHPEGWKDGVRAALSPAGAATVWTNGDWGAIGAWAWGLSRVADFLETDPDIDASRLAVIGHSRLGKTALWTGAQDRRFGVVISNNSGEGGAALMRRNYGETTAIITRAFPHWFTPTYAFYGDNEAACPVDQHMLIALMAPRAVYVASAVEDRRADPLANSFWPIMPTPSTRCSAGSASAWRRSRRSTRPSAIRSVTMCDPAATACSNMTGSGTCGSLGAISDSARARRDAAAGGFAATARQRQAGSSRACRSAAKNDEGGTQIFWGASP